MTLPYSSATSGKNAIADIQKMLKKFGCTKFATGEDFDTGDLFVQFEHNGFWVPEYIDLRGVESEAIVKIIKEKFISWGGFNG